MRALIVLVIALLPGIVPGIVLANDLPKPGQPKKPPPVVGNPCAQYGAGFVQLPGTTTCVRLGGSMQIDVGSSGRTR
jgi:hypothetical protein